MSKIYIVQPSEHVDRITKEGHELTKLPYPFFVDEKGMVGRQDVWKGDPYQVIGFAEDLAFQEVDLLWEEAIEDPSLAVGMYVVTSDRNGNFDTLDAAVSSMKLLPQEAL
jgi:hypothetical protein